MAIPVEIKCRDFGREGCLGEPDPRYTMRFDDIGEPPLYWCTACGPGAHALTEAFTAALQERGAEFRAKVEAAVEAAKNDDRRN